MSKRAKYKLVNVSNKVKAGAVVVIATTQANAGALTENVTFDLSDINYIFGGMIVAGVALYAIRKGKSLLGA
jgi:SepF-like predicted cell division protein (DUF552 family)